VWQVASETIRVRVDVEPIVSDLIKVLRRLPLEARRQMRVVSAAISEDEAEQIRLAADGTDEMAVMAARSVRVRTGDTPAIAAGGNVTVRAGRRGGRVTGSDVFFGSEFGGKARDTTQQFPVHRGREGYWFWPTLREDTPDIVDEWAYVLDDLADLWGRP
jgi:hypothetical protein